MSDDRNRRYWSDRLVDLLRLKHGTRGYAILKDWGWGIYLRTPRRRRFRAAWRRLRP